MDLRIYIKQTQQFDLSGSPIYFEGNNVNSLSPKSGFIPSGRQWPNFGSFIDVTDYVGDPYKLSMSWSAERDNEGFIAPGTFQAKKSASGTITFEDYAYRLIRKWLIDDVSAQLNSIDIEVKHIDDNGKECGTYRNWLIKATDLTWCEDGLCLFDATMKQKDEPMNCIRSTIISDNWQGWFQDGDNITKKHPRFSYCIEQRPNGMMIMIWWISLIVAVPTLTVLIPIMVALNGIFAVINVIIGIIKTIIAIVGGDDPDDVNWQTIPYFDFGKILDAFGAYFVESAGCGREHPAPLIRDYIYNVCAKCGIGVDAETAPVFFSPAFSIETASNGVQLKDNPHYNACYMHAQTERGIRRFKSLNALRGLPNNTDFYQTANRPLHTLDSFLDELKQLYNLEWNIRGGNLYIQRKDFFRVATNPYVFDFSTNGADRNKILEGICFEYNDNKIAAYAEGLYTVDAGDKCGNEARSQMNDFIQYGDASKIPVFDGKQDKLSPYGATKFRFDGASEDYILDAVQVIVNSSFLTPFMAGIMFDFVYPSFTEFADYALLLNDETFTLPKVLLWDGESYENARAIKPYSAWGITGTGMPNINPLYSTGKDWRTAHSPKTFVRGSGLTLPPNQPGYYLATDFFGAREIKRAALLVNYNMYMAVGYEDSMWDWFHWIDDPRRRNVLNRTATVKIEMCCDDLKRVQVFNDASTIVLGEKIALPLGEGIITNIEVNYDGSQERGKYIEIKANA
jgi:hypothetical protein